MDLTNKRKNNIHDENIYGMEGELGAGRKGGKRNPGN